MNCSLLNSELVRQMEIDVQMNLREAVLLTPGPVNLHPRVLQALSRPMIHHRTPLFEKIFLEVRNKLKKIFGTEQDVFILSTTGTGAMEALLVNTLKPGDEVIAIDSGKFGERWRQMAEAMGLIVHTIKVGWGKAVRVSDVKKLLEQYPLTRAVLCQACETSTATSHPIRELGELIRSTSALFLVDGITAVGAYPLPMDEWHIDGLAACSQKAFMLPTGLGFVSLSKKAWAYQKFSQPNKFYLNLSFEEKANQANNTFVSANVTLIRALNVAIDLMLENGIDQHLSQVCKRADFCRHFGLLLGLKLMSESPSNSVTAFLTPEGVNSEKIRDELEDRYRITVMGGQDQVKGKILRIGHMGYIECAHLESLFMALADLLPTTQLDKTLFQKQMRLWWRAHHV